jgi:hypothetical protein
MRDHRRTRPQSRLEAPALDSSVLGTSTQEAHGKDQHPKVGLGALVSQAGLPPASVFCGPLDTHGLAPGQLGAVHGLQRGTTPAPAATSSTSEHACGRGFRSAAEFLHAASNTGNMNAEAR